VGFLPSWWPPRRIWPRWDAGKDPNRSPAGSAASRAARNPGHAPNRAPATAPRPADACPGSTLALLTCGEASYTRSLASLSRPTPSWPSRTSPSPTSPATSVSPAQSVMPPGRSLAASSATRQRGWAPNWSPATAGSRPPRPARNAGRWASRSDWQSEPSAVVVVVLRRTGTAMRPRTSPPGPSATTPGPRTAKRAAGSSMPIEGKVLAAISVTVQPAPTKWEPRLGHLSRGHPRRVLSVTSVR
jgi:hypothetical protein